MRTSAKSDSSITNVLDVPLSIPHKESSCSGNGSGRAGQKTSQTRRNIQVSRKERKIRLLAWLTIIMGLSLCFTFMNLHFARQRVKAMEVEYVKMSEKLREAQESIQEMKLDIQHFVEGQFPGLRPIVFNRVLEINKNYLASITFYSTGPSSSPVIEYLAILKNDNHVGSVKPSVQILIFNEFGLQVGKAQLDNNQTFPEIEYAGLSTHETRSYRGKIQQEINSTPRYYKIQIH